MEPSESRAPIGPSMTAWNDSRFDQGLIRRNTHRGAAWHIRLFTDILGPDTPICEVTEDDIEAWRELLRDRLQPRSRNVALSTIRQYFLWASHPRRRLVTINPAAEIRNSRVPRPVRRRLRARQVSAVIGVGDLRARTMVIVFAHLGVRRSEAAALCWEDIDWETMTVTVNADGAKGEKERTVPLEGEAARALREWHAHLEAERPLEAGPLLRGPVWPSKRGGALASGSVARVVTDASHQAGLHIRPHDYRHHAAIEMHLNGAGAAVVQRFLGHESLETTGGYLRAVAEDVRPFTSRTSYQNGRWRANLPDDGPD